MTAASAIRKSTIHIQYLKCYPEEKKEIFSSDPPIDPAPNRTLIYIKTLVHVRDNVSMNTINMNFGVNLSDYY